MKIKTNAPLLLAAAGFLACFGLLAYHYRFSTVDDAYISFRYARNWVRGAGIVYNPGERVEGYTNFLWVALMTPIIALGRDPARPAQLLGSLCAAGTAVLTFGLALRLTSRRWSAAAAILILAANGAFVAWSISGLETPLVALMVTAIVVLALKPRLNQAALAGIGILSALGMMCRPDFVVLAAPVAVWILLRQPRDAAPPYRAAILPAIVWGAVYLPYYAWRFSYYGYPLPNTFYAKVGFSIWQIARGLHYLLQFPLSFGGFLVWAGLPMAALLPNSRTDRDQQHGLQFLACLMLFFLAYVCFVGGDGLGMSRFLVPVMPLWAVLVAAGADRVFCSIASEAAPLVRNLAGIAFSITVIGSVLGGSLFGMLARSHIAWIPYVSHWRQEGLWLRDHSAANARIAVFAAGTLPYYADRPCIDMLGLNDLHIAHESVSGMGKGRAGHEKRDYPYVLALRPQYIVANEGGADLSPLLLGAGYTAEHPLPTDPEFTLWEVHASPAAPH